MTKTTEELLTILGYTLLFAALVPQVVNAPEVTWALFPTWLVMTGYVASILKGGTEDETRARRYEETVMLVWLTYYALAIIWPLPMHWYDSLVIFALLFSRTTFSGSVLMAAYYMISAAAYAGSADALQVSGRCILAGVSVGAAWRSRPTPVQPKEEDAAMGMGSD
jgi:hypothetical protein